MTQHLLVMRHAKSSWKDRSITDHDRPLNDRGNRDAPRMASWLESQNVVPDLILCSSANRTQTTAQHLVSGFSTEIDVRVVEDFYLAAPQTYFEVLQQLPSSIRRPMVIGHNPGLEGLVECLSGEYHFMATATIAHFDMGIENWDGLANLNGSQELLDVWRPKEIEFEQ